MSAFVLSPPLVCVSLKLSLLPEHQAQNGVPVAFENMENYVRMLTIFGIAQVRTATGSRRKLE